MKEVWKDIKGYEGYYQVSNLGRVKSLVRIVYDDKGNKHVNTEKILSQSDDCHGYYKVSLCKDGKSKTMKVHRLVAFAFLENENNFNCVNHKDENKKNNNVNNLEFCTHRYNCNYGTAIEKRNLSRNNKEIAKGFCKKVYQYNAKDELIKIWDSSISTKEFGFIPSCVSACCRGRIKTHRGFKWSYYDLHNSSEEEKKKALSKNIHTGPIYQYDKNLNLLNVWNNSNECAKNGFSKPDIRNCCVGRAKTHKGYIWSFTPLD